MARNITIIGLPDYHLADITAGVAEVPTMPFANLDTPQPSAPCRLNSLDPSETWVEFNLENRSPAPGLVNPTRINGLLVGGVALVGHSLAPGAEVRIILGDQTLTPGAIEAVLPDGVSLTEMTGAAGDIDGDPFEGDAPGSDSIPVPSGLRLQAGATNPLADITLATPSAPPVGEQVLALRLYYTPAVDPKIFSMAITIRDGITEIAHWTARNWGPPLPTSGSVVQIPFDAGDLVTPDGSGLNVRFEAIIVGGGGAVDDIWIPAVRLLAATSAMVGVVDDSGWLEVGRDDIVTQWGETTPLSIGFAPQQTFAWVRPGGEEIGALRGRVEIRDWNNQVGYLDIGRILAGPAFQPGINRDWGELVNLVGRSKVNRGTGGSRFGVRHEPLREMELPFSHLTRAESAELLERLWRAGELTEFVVSVFEDGPEQRHTNLYVACDDLPKVTAKGDVNYRELSAKLIEVL